MLVMGEIESICGDVSTTSGKEERFPCLITHQLKNLDAEYDSLGKFPVNPREIASICVPSHINGNKHP